MKNNKITIYALVIVITIVSALVFLRTAIDATIYIPDSGSLETPLYVHTEQAFEPISNKEVIVVPTVIPSSTPLRLNIPSLHIDAHVQRLGITARGALGTPNNFVDVGWYAAGTIPGNIGSAIIDGHVDNGLSLAGVFKHLSDIATGSDIYIARQDGTIIHFIVTDIQSYDYENAPVGMIFNEHTSALLRLITCGGVWVPGGRTYNKRIVVTALLVQ